MKMSRERRNSVLQKTLSPREQGTKVAVQFPQNDLITKTTGESKHKAFFLFVYIVEQNITLFGKREREGGSL